VGRIGPIIGHQGRLEGNPVYRFAVRNAARALRNRG
jgi:hypothetical protein